MRKKMNKPTIRLGDEMLEKAVMKISELGQELAKWESLYEKYSQEMKYERDLAFIDLMKNKMTATERSAISNTQPQVVRYIELMAEAKEKYIGLRHKIKSAELFCDLFRTQSANIRREKKFYQELS
jgi:hypothetical protein